MPTKENYIVEKVIILTQIDLKAFLLSQEPPGYRKSVGNPAKHPEHTESKSAKKDRNQLSCIDKVFVQHRS